MMRMPICSACTVLALSFISVFPAAAEQPAQTQQPALTEQQASSYALGIQIGKRLANLGVPMDRDLVFRGICDVLDKKPLLVTPEDARVKEQAILQQALKRQVQEHQRLIVENMAAQKAFLEENGTKDGITQLESGLQYKVMRPGKGKAPALVDRVEVRYAGRLMDGSEFDNTEKRGGSIESQVNKFPMAGLREALQLMKEGDRWEIYIPSNLAYGMQPVPNVGPNQLLIMDVELLKVLGPPEEQKIDKNAAAHQPTETEKQAK